MTGPTRGPQIDATAISMLVLCTLAVGLRFLSRAVVKTVSYSWDDWVALISLPVTLGISALSLYWVSIGLGQHTYDLSTPLSKLLFPYFPFNYLFDGSLALTKVSVLLFYDRIFGRLPYLRLALWTIGFIIVAWWIAIDLVATFTCNPVQKLWEPQIPGKCIGQYPTYLAASIPNLATDVILLLIPMPLIWKLKVEWKTKLGVLGIFVCGYCVVLVSILHLVKIFELGKKFDVEPDSTWDIEPLYIYTILEPSMALISCCLPAIFHLIKTLSIKSGTRNSSKLAGRVRTLDPVQLSETLREFGGQFSGEPLVNKHTSRTTGHERVDEAGGTNDSSNNDIEQGVRQPQDRLGAVGDQINE